MHLMLQFLSLLIVVTGAEDLSECFVVASSKVLSCPQANIASPLRLELLNITKGDTFHCEVELSNLPPLWPPSTTTAVVKLKINGANVEKPSCDLKCTANKCSVGNLDHETMGLIIDAHFQIDFCTENGSYARTEFKLYFEEVELTPRKIQARDAEFTCKEDQIWSENYCAHLELMLYPRQYNETVLVFQNQINLSNLVPNRSYKLHVRIRKADGSVWSWWSVQSFKAKTEIQNILGYSNGSTYIASNEWNILLDDTVNYTGIRQETNERTLFIESSICIAAICDASKCAVTWELPQHYSSLSLRLIWTATDTLSTRNGTHLVNHMDFPLANATSYHFIEPISDSLSIGFGVVSNATNYSLINLLDTAHTPELSVWQVFNVHVTDIQLTQSLTVSWNTNQMDKGWHYKDYWAIEFSSPTDETIRIQPEFENGVYRVELGLNYCLEYTGVILWRDLVKSRSFSFVTATPAFNATNLTATAYDTSVHLQWDTPQCTYSKSSYFKVFLNEQLIETNLYHQLRKYQLEHLRRNTKYNLSLLSCQNQCLYSNISFRTSLNNLHNLAMSSTVVLKSSTITASCSTDEDVDFFIYIVRDVKDQELTRIELATCAFSDDCSYPANFSISIMAGIRLDNGSVILSEAKVHCDQTHHCNSNWYATFWVGSGVLIGSLLLFGILYRRRINRQQNFSIILPIELNKLIK